MVVMLAFIIALFYLEVFFVAVIILHNTDDLNYIVLID